MNASPPTRQAILQSLRLALPSLRQDFGVRSLALFGSAVRDEASSDSDVDILVEFDSPIGLIRFGQLQQRLEAVLGHRVDLVEPAALHPALKSSILAEAKSAA